ncbi:MAG: choice-of-anchor Q domain-containing protein [Pirellulales bacterium]
MSRQTFQDWFVACQRRVAHGGNNSRAASPHRRRLRLEPLEDRRLLAVVTVDTLIDENDGIDVGGTSLRDAIAAAMPSDTIDFAVMGTITLEHGELVVNKELSIVGPGADVLSIDADSASRVFNIDDGTGALATVSISGLTISGGYIAGDGGGVSNAENLTIVASTISGNTSAHSGGGVFTHQGSLTIRDSTLSGNTAQYGGGLYVVSGRDFTTTITNSTVSGNTATDGGGGIYNFLGRLLIEQSTITDNEADPRRGAGVASWGDQDATLTEVYSSIVSGNRSNQQVAGYDVDVVGGPVMGPENTVVSLGYNLVGSGSAVGEFTAPGDLPPGMDPLLGPLNDNGGPTKTHALLYGSIAIDAGDDTFTPPPDHDQRGEPFARVFGGRMDIGAFEAEASYFRVDTLMDEDDGIGVGAGTSLRDALAAANFIDVVAAVITFDPALTEIGPRSILLTYGQLNVDANVTIAGPGANRLTIDAQGASRVMLVDDFDGGSLSEVTIRGLTLTGGVHAGQDEGGGGIFNNERLTLRASILTGNEARWGGGIYNFTDGELTVERSTLSGNSAMFGGAGVYNWGGDVDILETTVSGNDAADAAGVLNANSGEMLIEASTISGNHATGGNGGGILQAGGLLTIRNSTISGNEADNEGGGIQHAFGPLEIYHSTITANRADADQSGIGFGGGIFHVLGPTLLVDHTIVAGNFRQASNRDDVAGSFDARFSLFGDATGSSINDLEGSLIGDDESPIDPLLGDLEDNGGPTLTHALLTDSPAIDTGDPDFNPPPDYDQRGVRFDRESGGQIDIGAFEVQSAVVLPSLPGDYNLDEAVDAADYTVWRDTLGQEVAAYDSADGDGDGTIDEDDYDVWKSNFGNSISIFGYAALAGGGAGGGPILVTTLADTVDLYDGVTSLREAIFAANIVPGTDTIKFAPSLIAVGPATILLSLGELDITDSLVVHGPGAALLTIDASGNDADPEIFGDGSRIFNVDDGNSGVIIDVTICGLTLTGGDVGQFGGAILSRERLVAEELVITGNQATLGGAIAMFAAGGESIVADSTIVDNQASSQGGAFYIQGGLNGTVVIRDNTIADNSANRGGALYAGQSSQDTTLVIAGNTIRDNSAIQQGGAIYLASTSAPKTSIRSSLLSGNTAGQQGGALFVNNVRDLAVVDCQFVDNKSLATNSAQGRGGAIYGLASDLAISGSTISGSMAVMGGGIHSRDGELSISFSSIADNSATAGDGGGIYSGGDRLSIVGSTISGNTATGVFAQAGRGGGLWHAVGSLAPTSILDSVFASNTSTNYGGGADFRSMSEGIGGALMLTNVDFTNNASNRGGGIAFAVGGLGSSSGSVAINGGLIADNSASLNGGGIYGRTGAFQAFGTTISGNQAGGSGGGIAVPQTGVPIMTMSLVDAMIVNNSANAATPPPRGGGGSGGGIWIPSGMVSLTLLDTVVSHNSARQGGGISRSSQSVSGNLSAIDSTISGNTATAHGGGIYNIGSGALSFTRTVIAGNVSGAGAAGPGAPPNGGGIFSRTADVTLVASSLTGNSTISGRGGGLYMTQTGDLNVTGSTIADNFARSVGGGVWVQSGPTDRVSIHSSTVSGNSSDFGTGGLAVLGGLTIRNSTITRNVGGRIDPSGNTAGGISFSPINTTLELDHVIVAGNSAPFSPPDLQIQSLQFATIRFSLIGDNNGTPLAEAPLGSPDASGNLIGRRVSSDGSGVINPLLAPLAQNGGPTRTHALLPGSPALDGGALITGPPQGFDQRGNPFSRMVDGTGDGVVRIDMGAYESQGVPSFSPGDYSRNGIVDAADYTLWRNTLSEQPVPPSSGADGNGDGVVNFDDYAIWKAHFGAGLVFTLGGGGGSSAIAAPEPLGRMLSPAALEFASQPPVLPGVRTSATKLLARSIPVSDAREHDALVAWLAAQPRRANANDDAFAQDTDESAASDADEDPVEAVIDTAFAAFGV